MLWGELQLCLVVPSAFTLGAAGGAVGRGRVSHGEAPQRPPCVPGAFLEHHRWAPQEKQVTFGNVFRGSPLARQTQCGVQVAIM